MSLHSLDNSSRLSSSYRSDHGRKTSKLNRSLTPGASFVSRPSAHFVRGTTFGYGPSISPPLLKATYRISPGDYELPSSFDSAKRSFRGSSSFSNSGRSGAPLLSDGKHYKTMRVGIGQSMVSPSYYRIPSSFRRNDVSGKPTNNAHTSVFRPQTAPGGPAGTLMGSKRIELASPTNSFSSSSSSYSPSSVFSPSFRSSLNANHSLSVVTSPLAVPKAQNLNKIDIISPKRDTIPKSSPLQYNTLSPKRQVSWLSPLSGDDSNQGEKIKRSTLSMSESSAFSAKPRFRAKTKHSTPSSSLARKGSNMLTNSGFANTAPPKLLHETSSSIKGSPILHGSVSNPFLQGSEETMFDINGPSFGSGPIPIMESPFVRHLAGDTSVKRKRKYNPYDEMTESFSQRQEAIESVKNL
eukprot:g2115.t1